MSNKKGPAFILMGVAAINTFKIFSKLSKQKVQKQDFDNHYESHIGECPIEIGYAGEVPLECSSE